MPGRQVNTYLRNRCPSRQSVVAERWRCMDSTELSFQTTSLLRRAHASIFVSSNVSTQHYAITLCEIQLSEAKTGFTCRLGVVQGLRRGAVAPPQSPVLGQEASSGFFCNLALKLGIWKNFLGLKLVFQFLWYYSLYSIGCNIPWD